MPKRGRPPKDEASRKSEPVSIRLTPELRNRLEAERTSADPQRTLSQEIELRIRESFDLDKSIKELLGGADHYWFMRFVAQQLIIMEHQTGRKFLKDRFTFDQVKDSINTILDYYKPRGASSPPEHLTQLPEGAIRELGKRSALLMLSSLKLAEMRRDNLLVLPDFVDPIAASQHLPMRKNPIEELNEIWQREQKLAVRTTAAKPRRSLK
jgi:hypothetical protein